MTTEERFWAKVDKNGPNGCWVWTGDRARGYGRFRSDVNGKSVAAHRFAYELLVGPIPEGLTIDHLCRVRRCVNPEHLEPVTQRENILRGTNQVAINARKTHCIHGHEFTSENTYIGPRGDRGCRTCKRIRARRYRKAETA